MNYLGKAKETILVRYLFVGGLSYVFELSTLLGIVFVFHISRTIGAAISYLIGLSVAFILQKVIAFQNLDNEIVTLRKQGLSYAILAIWNYIFTVAVISIISQKYLIESRTAAVIIMSLWNYIIYKKV